MVSKLTLVASGLGQQTGPASEAQTCTLRVAVLGRLELGRESVENLAGIVDEVGRGTVEFVLGLTWTAIVGFDNVAVGE